MLISTRTTMVAITKIKIKRMILIIIITIIEIIIIIIIEGIITDIIVTTIIIITKEDIMIIKSIEQLKNSKRLKLPLFKAEKIHMR